jgi:hypothetical protein
LDSKALSLEQPEIAVGAGRLRVLDRLAPALLVPLIIFNLGYMYEGPNYALLSPWIIRLSRPELLARDWFANTIPHHANFVRLLAWSSSALPLPAVVLSLHVAALFLLLWTAYGFAARLFGDKRIFYAAVFLLLRWGTEGLGGNSLWADYLVPHNAAAPVCLLAFYLSLSGRPLSAALTAAAATWIHIQLGVLTMAVLGGDMLVSCVWGGGRGPSRSSVWKSASLRPMFTAGGIYAAAVAPTFLKQWGLYVMTASPLTARQFLDVHAILRQPHHLIPSTWPLADYARFFLILGMGALAVSWRNPLHRKILVWSLIILAYCVAGSVFVEIIPIKLVIKMQLFRMTIFLKFFAVLFAAQFLIRTLDLDRWEEKCCALAILAIQNFLVVGACAVLIPAFRKNRRWAWTLSIAAAECLAVSGIAGAGVGGWLQHALRTAPRGIEIGLITLGFLGAIVWRNGRLLPAGLMILAAALPFAAGIPSFHYDHPPIDDWYRFCRQVRAATPADAVFITPPVMGGFQMFAERAEVADFKSTPSIERDLVEWKHRMDDLAGGAGLHCSGWAECSAALTSGYAHLTRRNFIVLAQKYRAEYVVTPRPEPWLGFPEVLRVGDFVLYRLPA